MLRFHFTDFRHCDRFAVREKARSAWVLDASIFVLDRSFAECDLRDEAAMFAGPGASLRFAATDVERRVVDVQVVDWFWKRSVVFRKSCPRARSYSRSGRFRFYRRHSFETLENGERRD